MDSLIPQLLNQADFGKQTGFEGALKTGLMDQGTEAIFVGKAEVGVVFIEP